MDKKYDRAEQDIGNSVGIGHVNVCIDDQHKATHFYITGLGYTRDPFLNTGAGNMWVNVGMSQFHLPMGTPDVLRGVTGLVMPDRKALLDRLQRVKRRSRAPNSSSAKATTASRPSARGATASPCMSPMPSRFGRVQLGMPYVRFDVRPGTAERIARFYREILDAPAEVKKNGAGPGGKSSGRREPILLFPRDRRAGGSRTTGTTFKSISPISRGPTASCSISA